MSPRTQTDLLIKIAELSEFAKRGDDFFPDEICTFLTDTFSLDAAVIFSLADKNFLTAIGKSANARKNYVKGTSHQCADCKLIKENTENSVYSNSECPIQISDFLLYETCCLIKVTENHKLIIKIARKLVFNDSEQESFEKISSLLSFLFFTWMQINGSIISSNISLNKIVKESAQELKNNVNSIIGFTSIIADENSSPANIEYLNSIKKNAQSLLLSFNDISELSKIESGTVSQQMKKVSLGQIIGDLATLFENKVGKNKLKFRIEIADKLRDQIELDEAKLKYIFTNLFIFLTITSSDGLINVAVNPARKRKISFTVSTTTKGITTEVQELLFEPFSLSKIPEIKNSSLSGLSLTLIKKYVNLLGGEITVSGGSDNSTIINFTINGDVMTDIETTLSQLPKPTSKNKVLVIEDDYATSKLLSNYLNKWGYDPTIVSTEDQAFTVINNEQLLAIILDIEIPNINGLELLKKIHDNPNAKNVPVIACSIEPEQQKAFLMGAVEYFIKPINYNYLVEVLTHYKLRKNSNVLCVDDDVPTLNLVKQAIESVGFNAIAENVSARVMDLIRDKDIDLAIVDLDMPTPNGFELIKLIKTEKRFANLPIIIYTGKENYKEDLYKIEGLFEELLDKRSTNLEDLADTINAMINRYETPPPVEEVIHKKGGTKILLAEDYKHSQIIVTRLLKKNNYEDIVVVENGEDAVKMANNDKFDLILMDMQMPIMNGFEATEKIREIPDYKNIPIIALTAFAMKGDREKCLESGATDYIPKPIDSKEFIDKVRYYTNA